MHTPQHPIRTMTRRAALGVVVAGVGAAATGCTATTSTPRTAASGSPTPTAAFGALATAALPHSAALQSAIQGAVGAGAPAVLAAVATADGVWSGASGIDGPNGRKATASDVAPIASVSKTFLAALVFRLAEQGRISLDDPLAKWLDAPTAAKANGATVRQALAQRAGLPDTQGAVLKRISAKPSVAPRTAQIVASLPAADGKPGGPAAASNPTWKLLGMAAERAGGAPLADLVRDLVVVPSGVQGTLIVQHAGLRTPGPWALPTEDGPWGVGGTLPFLADSAFSVGASAMAADVASLAAWAWQLFAGKVVSTASLAAMMQHGEEGIGSGLDPVDPVGSDPAFGHPGSKNGYSILLTVVPARRQVAVVVVTANDADTSAIAASLLDAQ